MWIASWSFQKRHTPHSFGTRPSTRIVSTAELMRILETIFLSLILLACQSRDARAIIAHDFTTLLFREEGDMDMGLSRRYVQMPVEGERRYMLYIPSGMIDPPALLLNWHSFFLFSELQAFWTQMNSIADENRNFIIAYPQAHSALNGFHAGDSCCDVSDPVDDLGYAVAIIEDIKANMKIDLRRIYSYGFSQGGGMSNYLGYQLPQYIAAISTNAFALMPEHFAEAEVAKEKNPNFHPVPVQAIHGYNDFLYCWEPQCLSLIAFPSYNNGKEGWHRWAKLNDCQGEPVTLAEKPMTPQSRYNRDHDEYYWIKAYQNCSGGVEVQQILNSNSHGGEGIIFGLPGFAAQILLMDRVIEFLFRWTLPENIRVTEPAWWSESWR